MPRGVCRPLAGCKPMGVMMGAMALSGIVMVIIGAVGLYSFTPSDLLQQYNDAVQAWEEYGVTVFQNNNFWVCRSSRQRFCSPLHMLTNTSEGQPPGREYNSYEALMYKTADDPGLLRNRVPFECDNSTVLSVSLFHKDDKEVTREVSSITVPVYAWRQTSITDQKECDNELGLYWKSHGEEHCFNIFVLNRLCLTVNKTSSWSIASFQKNTEAGCSTNPGDLVGCGMPVNTWGYGGYSLVDGRDISKEIIHNSDDSHSGHQNPTTLPKSRWTANLSSVDVTIRSIFDPILNAEVSTNGSLDFDKESSGQYAFSGNLVGFTGWSIFMVGLTIGATPVLVVVMIAILFPQLRFRYFYKSQHPDNFMSFTHNNNINSSGKGKFTFPPPDSGSGSLTRTGSARATPRS